MEGRAYKPPASGILSIYLNSLNKLCRVLCLPNQLIQSGIRARGEVCYEPVTLLPFLINSSAGYCYYLFFRPSLADTIHPFKLHSR
uniref:Uncharacterized protein n=1 Tax=Picea glauca TaxID=3330 RepID=A0A117NGF2_PICGL|nr:hypothetical protein ABT39_MTgene1382 [Picea glauca]QHR89463.1 hypothetical protein Q903MT_gene3484 [Picea sitchensis]